MVGSRAEETLIDFAEAQQRRDEEQYRRDQHAPAKTECENQETTVSLKEPAGMRILFGDYLGSRLKKSVCQERSDRDRRHPAQGQGDAYDPKQRIEQLAG